MDKRLIKSIKKYIKNNEFIEEDKFENLILKYKNIEKNKIIYFYKYMKEIYENLYDDNIILRIIKKVYEKGGIELMQCSLYILYELLAKTKNYNISTYPRKLEFLYQTITPEWQA